MMREAAEPPADPREDSSRRLQQVLEDDISIHIFSASAGLVGVCLTVIGLFRAVGDLNRLATVGDELLAVDALAFLTSCMLAYAAFRTRARRRRHRLERAADAVFLGALCVMAVVCGMIAYELV